MKLSANNFLTIIKQVVTGGGNDAQNIPLNDAGFVVDRQLSTAESSAAAQTALPDIAFRVPRDYDEATDYLSLIFTADMAGATDTPAVTVTVIRARAGVADSTIASGVSVLAGLSEALQEGRVDLSGNGLLRGDVLNIVFTAGAHTTDGITNISATAAYRSCLVSYDDEDDADGYPLR